MPFSMPYNVHQSFALDFPAQRKSASGLEGSGAVATVWKTLGFQRLITVSLREMVHLCQLSYGKGATHLTVTDGDVARGLPAQM